MSLNKHLSHLFQDSDIVYTGSVYAYDGSDSAEFFCINPLTSLDKRTDDNVSCYRNFLFEFDTGTREEQLNMLNKVQLPITSKVWSGSKSIHAIIGLADTLTTDYRLAWQALALEMSELAPDVSCKNPSRLSRIGGHYRSNGNIQELVELGPFIKNDKIKELVAKHGLRSSPRINPATPKTYKSRQHFESVLRAHAGLYKSIKNHHMWMKEVNNYPEMFKLTLWAIDELGVDYETFSAYIIDEFTDKLRAVSYSPQRLLLAINHAYNFKT